jgi:hypothetical protein
MKKEHRPIMEMEDLSLTTFRLKLHASNAMAQVARSRALLGFEAA